MWLFKKKHKDKPVVIDHGCYNQLSTAHKKLFAAPTEHMDVTHYVSVTEDGNDGDIVLEAIELGLETISLSSFDSGSSSDFSSSGDTGSSDFGGFGGGDSGGGGAGSDY